MNRIILSLALLICMCSSLTTRASHGQGADISYKYLSTSTQGQLCYQITLALYRDCSGIPIGNTADLQIFDSCTGIMRNKSINQILGLPCAGGGVSTANGCEVTQICTASLPQTTCNGPSIYPGVQKYIYQDTIYVSPCMYLKLSTQICARNSADNTSNSGCLYVDATIHAGTLQTAPVEILFAHDPVVMACANNPVAYNMAASALAGDSLVYELIAPLGAFNSPLAFNVGYSQSSPVITTASGAMVLDSHTGMLTFTPAVTPRMLVSGNINGEVDVLAMRVSIYRSGILIGSVIRDCQIKIIQCNQDVVTLDSLMPVPNARLTDTITVTGCAPTPISLGFRASSYSGQNITLTSNIGLSATILPNMTFAQLDTGGIVHGLITWTVPDSGCRYVTIRAESNDCPVLGRADKTYRLCAVNDVHLSASASVYCGQAVTLAGTGGINPVWSPALGLSSTNTFTTIATPASSTTYHYSSSCGSDSILIAVRAPIVLPSLNDAYICTGSPYQIDATATSAGPYTYAWSPATGLYHPVSSIPNNTIPNPVLITSKKLNHYICTVTDSAGCSNSVAVTITVNGAGTLVLKGDTTIPATDTIQLSALVNNYIDTTHYNSTTNLNIGTGNIISFKLGTGFSTYMGGAASYPSPYGSASKSARHQMLIRASEIKAASGKTGPRLIKELSMYIKSIPGVGSSILNNFTIEMGQTNEDSLPSLPSPRYSAVSLQQVFSPKTVTISSSGTKVHIFDNAFVWDGVSNLIVDICFTNTVSGGKSPKLEYTNTAYRAQYCTFDNTTSMCGITGTQASVPISGYEYTRPNIYFRMDSIVPTFKIVTTIPNHILWSPSTGINAVSDSSIYNPIVHPLTTQVYTATIPDSVCPLKSTVLVTIPGSIPSHPLRADTSTLPLVAHLSVDSTIPSDFIQWYYVDTAGHTIVLNHTGKNLNVHNIGQLGCYYAVTTTGTHKDTTTCVHIPFPPVSFTIDTTVGDSVRVVYTDSSGVQVIEWILVTDTVKGLVILQTGGKILQARVDKSGKIGVRLYDPASGQFNTVYITHVTRTVLGIGELLAGERITLDPNPSSSLIHIRYPATLYPVTHISCINVAGQQVHSHQLSSREQLEGHTILDVSQWVKGIYILNIYTTEGSIAKRLVIE
jgi:Secretion system C-terminal sorting domain